MPVPGKIEKAADHGGSGGNTNKHFFRTHSFFKSGLQFHILLIFGHSSGGLWAGLAPFFKLLLGLNCR